MSQKEASFAIVDDDDDDDDFDIDAVEDSDGILTPNFDGKPPSMHQFPRENYESSGEESNVSPKKKFQQFVNAAAGASSGSGDLLTSGRQTVTKIRPSPQLIQISSESESDSDDSPKKSKVQGEYDPKMFEELEVSEEIKDLFQYITKYVPQHLGQDYKFKPFIPDYIPAVGDIDAFLKVVPPETNLAEEVCGVDQSGLGLTVLDEPAANQSDPAVLHLQLRASSVNISNNTADMVIKKVDNLERNSKIIDKWIKDISDLHRSKSSPILKYLDAMPDLDELMEEWPENMENLLKIHGFPSYNLQGPLSRYIDIVACLFDIPIYQNRIQSLHLLFSLYAAVKTSHLYRTSSSSKTRNSSGHNNSDVVADQLVLE